MADFRTRFEAEGGIGRLTLNRPERLNAITNRMVVEVHDDAREAFRAFVEKRPPRFTGPGG